MDPSRTDSIRSVVGIDIETTGLDPTTAEIIEVAAIRYDWRGDEQARFEQLCSTAQPIPPFVTTLTGITPGMVEGQPRFESVIDQLREFIGSDVVFAHNAQFDLTFLKQHGLELKNPVWDTFTLSGVAWPTLPSYNLGSLQAWLKLPSKGEHRAAADIEVTWHLLQRIREQLALSPSTRSQIADLLGRTGQSHYAELFGETSKDPAAPPEADTRSGHREELKGISEILGPDGLLAKNLPEFSVRPEQITMAETVEKTLKTNQVSLIEAGTGTGKTYGYLVPLFLSLAEKKRRVYISTHSKYLQDQLMKTDIPRLQQALGTTYKVSSLKGKNNYICSTRLTAAVSKGTLTGAESWVLIKILTWLDGGGSGDLEELNLSHQPNYLLKRLNADSALCASRCTADTCLYKKIRLKAQEAAILVINHALLMQMRKGTDQRTRPQVVVIDEAHHLPEIARSASRFDFSVEAVSELLQSLTEAFSSLKEHTNYEHIATLQTELAAAWEGLLDSAFLFLSSHSPKRKLLLTPQTRRMSGWKKIHTHGQDILQHLRFLKGLSEGLKPKVTSKDAPLAEQAITVLERFIEHFEGFLEGNSDRIQWLEIRFYRDTQYAVLGDMLSDTAAAVAAVLTDAEAVILTSATLTTGNNFSYIRQNLGLKTADEKQLVSSFNYREQMMVYIVEDSPAPYQGGFDQYTGEIIQEISLLLGGKVLGLFTSNTAVKSVFNMTNSSLHAAHIKLFAQNMTGGKNMMSERFKKGSKTVLLGTNSFWEGLDVPGSALSAVVIPKLPFTPPDDPVLQTARNKIGSRAFEKVAVPEMLLRLRQGIGRLIRTSTDKGVIILLDSRILGSSYRDEVLKSLPAATVHIGKRKELSHTVREWFGSPTLQSWRNS